MKIHLSGVHKRAHHLYDSVKIANGYELSSHILKFSIFNTQVWHLINIDWFLAESQYMYMYAYENYHFFLKVMIVK